MLFVQENELSAGEIYIYVQVSTCAQGSYGEKGCY